MRIKVFKTILFIFILILFLNSCSDSRYILDGFFTEEELEKYKVHPEHKAVASYVAKVTENRGAVDIWE